MQRIGDVHDSQSSIDSVSPVQKEITDQMHKSVGPTPSEQAPTNTPENIPSENEHSWWSLFAVIALILGLALGIRFFVMAPYLVEGASMEETFHSFDYLMVDRITYRYNEPQRGDVVVMKFPLDTSRSFIKRVIGLPGETVEMQGTTVTIYNDENPDGLVIEESYVDPRHSAETELSVTLSDEEYFVLGDNRAESADSRYWGALPHSDIVGRPLIRIYPFNNIQIFPGEARYTSNSAEDSNNY